MEPNGEAITEEKDCSANGPSQRKRDKSNSILTGIRSERQTDRSVVDTLLSILDKQIIDAYPSMSVSVRLRALSRSMSDMGSNHLRDSSAPLTDAEIRSFAGIPENPENVAPSYATLLNRRLLDADDLLSDAAPRESVPLRIAIVSLLFNWPSTGGGIVHTAELAQFLSLDGYEVCHFFAVYEPWSVGKVTEPLTYNSCAIQFDEQGWNRTGIETAFRNAVDTFQSFLCSERGTV